MVRFIQATSAVDDQWRMFYALRNSIYFISYSVTIMEWDYLILAFLVTLEHPLKVSCSSDTQRTLVLFIR